MLTQERLKELLKYDPTTGIFTWRSQRGGTYKKKTAGAIYPKLGYCVIGIDYKDYYAHRLAWLYIHGVWPKEQIDHINKNRSDNRLSNLREDSRFARVT